MNKTAKLISTLVISSLALTAFVASADDSENTDPAFTWTYNEDAGRLLVINDGRINSWEVAAPVAIYYTWDMVIGGEGSIVPQATGIELLGINADGEGELVLTASLDDLQTLADGSAAYLEADGYRLYYVDGSFTVIAPPDYEGKTYSFTWESKALTLE